MSSRKYLYYPNTPIKRYYQRSVWYERAKVTQLKIGYGREEVQDGHWDELATIAMESIDMDVEPKAFVENYPLPEPEISSTLVIGKTQKNANGRISFQVGKRRFQIPAAQVIAYGPIESGNWDSGTVTASNRNTYSLQDLKEKLSLMGEPGSLYLVIDSNRGSVAWAVDRVYFPQV